jgi:hypothetical protein
MMYPVEKGIPIPDPDRSAAGHPLGNRFIYPWTHMAVGDSFFVPCTSKTSRSTVNRVSSGAVQYANKFPDMGMSFTVRTLRDDETCEVVGIRCWRTQ